MELTHPITTNSAIYVEDLAAQMPRKKRSGRAFQPTDDDRRTVTLMGAMGCKHSHIALIVNIDPKTLRKHFRRELDTAATIFWVKTRCGFRSTGSPCDDDITPVSSHSSPIPSDLAPAGRAPLPEPIAYNNDGEPNVDA